MTKAAAAARPAKARDPALALAAPVYFIGADELVLVLMKHVSKHTQVKESIYLLCPDASAAASAGGASWGDGSSWSSSRSRGP